MRQSNTDLSCKCLTCKCQIMLTTDVSVSRWVWWCGWLRLLSHCFRHCCVLCKSPTACLPSTALSVANWMFTWAISLSRMVCVRRKQGVARMLAVTGSVSVCVTAQARTWQICQVFLLWRCMCSLPGNGGDWSCSHSVQYIIVLTVVFCFKREFVYGVGVCLSVITVHVQKYGQ